MKVFRYTAAVDDHIHVFQVSGPIIHVSARTPYAIEFWVLDGQDTNRSVALRTYGTGHKIEEDDLKHLGTVIVAGGELVWHLFQVGECYDHDPIQHRDGKPPWCRACGLTSEFKKPEHRAQHR